jgi:quinol monooxygenase YgiN
VTNLLTQDLVLSKQCKAFVWITYGTLFANRSTKINAAQLQTMILSFITLIPQPEKRQAMLDILRTMEALTRTKPGCLSCCIYEQANDKHAVLYVEKWQSMETLERHVQSSMYMRLLTAMELASEEPKIEFHEVEKTMGMDLIEALRSAGGE